MTSIGAAEKHSDVTEQMPRLEELTIEERLLIRCYRELTEPEQQFIRRALNSLVYVRDVN